MKPFFKVPECYRLQFKTPCWLVIAVYISLKYGAFKQDAYMGLVVVFLLDFQYLLMWLHLPGELSGDEVSLEIWDH